MVSVCICISLCLGEAHGMGNGFERGQSNFPRPREEADVAALAR